MDRLLGVLALILYNRFHLYLSLQLRRSLLANHRLITLYQRFRHLNRIWSSLEFPIALHNIGWFLKVHILFVFADSGIANYRHQYRSEICAKGHLSVFIVHNHKKPLIEHKAQRRSLLLHLVLYLLPLQAINQVQNMPSIHVLGHDVDRFFESGGKLDAGSSFAGLLGSLADLDIIVGHDFDFLWNNMSLLKLLMTEDNNDNDLQKRFLFENKRKLVIQSALMRLKKKNELFLQSLESNAKWRKIYNGLLFNNCQSELNKLISLQLCEARQNDEASFFNPFEKIPITMCYNKFNKLQIFEKQAIYNLVLLYDSKTKKDMNWNKIDETAKSTIRALHISQLCERNDKGCFERELQTRVLEKQRFKGKTINFEELYKSSIQDMTPISQIMQN